MSNGLIYSANILDPDNWKIPLDPLHFRNVQMILTINQLSGSQRLSG